MYLEVLRSRTSATSSVKLLPPVREGLSVSPWMRETMVATEALSQTMREFARRVSIFSGLSITPPPESMTMW
jgi:hypothetical protein